MPNLLAVGQTPEVMATLMTSRFLAMVKERWFTIEIKNGSLNKLKQRQSRGKTTG